MPRRRQYIPLQVCLNNRHVGYLEKQPSGAVEFSYASSWLDWEQAFPVSLSLPLREDVWRGAPVVAVFENLLPDSDVQRRRVAEKVGAAGTDAYSLLSTIGRDCVGALQFLPKDAENGLDSTSIDGVALKENEIENILKNLVSAPLGLTRDDDFRISVAGAQEKTALLRHNGQWLKPRGTTPTTHLFKTQIGQLPNGIDLSNSIENEFYCLKLAEAFGLKANKAEIQTFGDTKSLIIERFDRLWTADSRLLRLPQEDCCQALSIPPTQKYQNEGGPSIVAIFELLKGSDSPMEDSKAFLKSQILFWLIGATDGHGKNFSIFLRPGGSYSLTPLYDVLSAQPSLDNNQIRRNQMKMAMSVGNNNHYKIYGVHARHFLQTCRKAGLPDALTKDSFEEMREIAEKAIASVETALPEGFPEQIHASVANAIKSRLNSLTLPKK